MSSTYCEICGEDPGMTSHYHCFRCNGECSMMGHETNYCKVYGNGTPRHACCPGNCQFDTPEEFQESLDFWTGLEHERDTDYSMVKDDYIKALAFSASVRSK